MKKRNKMTLFEKIYKTGQVVISVVTIVLILWLRHVLDIDSLEKRYLVVPDEEVIAYIAKEHNIDVFVTDKYGNMISVKTTDESNRSVNFVVTAKKSVLGDKLKFEDNYEEIKGKMTELNKLIPYDSEIKKLGFKYEFVEIKEYKTDGGSSNKEYTLTFERIIRAGMTHEEFYNSKKESISELYEIIYKSKVDFDKVQLFLSEDPYKIDLEISDEFSSFDFIGAILVDVTPTDKMPTKNVFLESISN